MSSLCWRPTLTRSFFPKSNIAIMQLNLRRRRDDNGINLRDWNRLFCMYCGDGRQSLYNTVGRGQRITKGGDWIAGRVLWHERVSEGVPPSAGPDEVYTPYLLRLPYAGRHVHESWSAARAARMMSPKPCKLPDASACKVTPPR